MSMQRSSPYRIGRILAILAVLAATAPSADTHAQEAAPTGSITGQVLDERGAPVAGAEVYIQGLGQAAQTRADGRYTLARVPVGTHTIAVGMLGFRPQSSSITVTAGAAVEKDFRVTADALKLQALVVTGNQVPRTNLESPVAVTTMAPAEIEAAAPRSTTEMLRYVPGFTRVESSGGEVNQNITMRGILGVEYVMFMEDGLPVFPTMHTFFMNADNLFRPDENIQRMEVVRGGSSALFGSNTPGAIINFINKTGGSELAGTMKATAGTEGLARMDFGVNGPIDDDWRFNVGGFYRYDHGVRNPGYPGIRGGQVKASLTRLLQNGYVRGSLKMIDDRNQFILPLPFQNPGDPRYVSGFSDYGAMNTPEGLHLRVPTPEGSLQLPLDDGLRTRAVWLTGDARFDLDKGWSIRNSAQVMQNDQGWNAILPFDIKPADVWAADQIKALGLPSGSRYQFAFTNHQTSSGAPLGFNTANGLVSPGGQWHVEKPIAAFQNQLQVQKEMGRHSISAGLYFGHYTQTNRWFFTDILMDVRDQPRYLDLVVYDQAGKPVEVTKNGFRKFTSNYVNGTGHTTILSGVLGGSFQLTERLRMDAGLRYEWDDFVQRSENATTVDLDGNPATAYNNVRWGSGKFRHFSRTMDDFAGSLALNYRVSDELSVYGLGSRAYKMPALDEFLNVGQQSQVDLFDARKVQSIEGGVKHVTTTYGLTVNGFLTELRNVVTQGAITDPRTGAVQWLVRNSPETRAYGAEIEFKIRPTEALDVLASGTILKSSFAECPADPLNPGKTTCPAGADVGTFLNGVPPVIGNLSAVYTLQRGTRIIADWHYVHRRYSALPVDGKRNELPTYQYMNFGAQHPLPIRGMSFSVNVLNALQSRGLEEGNPRLTDAGGRTSDLFLARPILPRRFTTSLRYDF